MEKSVSDKLSKRESTDISQDQAAEKRFTFDKNFQEKILQAMLVDRVWATQFTEVLDVDYFEHAHLKLIADKYTNYQLKYKEFPSMELLLTMIKDDLKNGSDAFLKDQIKQFLIRVESNQDMGDLNYVKDKSLEFCKKAALQAALLESVDLAQTENYEKIVDVVRKAISAGNEQSAGLELGEDIEARYSETYRRTIPTGIPELDGKTILNGGLGSGEIGFVVAPTGCHARGTLLPLFNGKLKAVEDIGVGDKLLGPDGRGRNVLRLISGKEQMYEIVPIKGKPFIVNENHILSLVRTGDGTGLANKTIDISVKEYLKTSKTFKHIHKLYRPEAFEFQVPKAELEIEPYILGLMLGDGYLHPKRIEITSADSEVANELKSFAAKNDVNISKHIKPGNRAVGYYFTNNKKHNNPIVRKLSSLGLIGRKSHNKFVPNHYKTASINDRLELLAGLIDSDGHNTGKCTYEFVSKSQMLASDVVFLSQTLGLAASKKTKTINGVDYFRIHISGDVDKIPCRISRKIQKQTRKQKKSALRTGFKLVKKDVDDFFGFTLDGDHLYVNDDFVVNHNCGKSHALVHFGSSAIRSGRNVVHYTFELNERVTGIRYDSHLTEIPSLDCYDRKEEIKEFYKQNSKKFGRLMIKYFPTGQASCHTLRTHLEKLSHKGFIPDLIVVDYAGIMRSADRNDLLRLELKKVCEELRSLAEDMGVPVWTAIQSNKEGSNSDVVDLTNLAESYSQAHVADFVLGISRQSSQKATGFGTMFVAKNRAGRDGIKYQIHMDTSRSKLRVLTDSEAAQFTPTGELDERMAVLRRFEENYAKKQ